MDLLIYGSCVSRDMLEFCEPKGIDLRGYIARQSWCSVGRPAKGNEFPAGSFSSPFLERTYKGDLKGDALTRISRAAADFPNLHLLIDLTDERGGFFEAPSGAVISNTPDSPAADSLNQEMGAWRYLRFGSLGHALEFTDAAEKLAEGLKKIGIWDRTVVLANKWAETLADDQPTARSFRMSADDANVEYADYFEMLEATGWNVAHPQDESPIADSNHKWGAAPFHYTRAYYFLMWNITGLGG